MPDWREIFDDGVEADAPLTDEHLAAVPAKRGVVLLTAGPSPLVLFTAASIRSRVQTRLRDAEDRPRKGAPDLKSVTQGVFWKRTSSHFETDLEYFELARAIWPKRWAPLLSWKPPWLVRK